MTALIARPASALKGVLTAPGDKSMSHRALMLASLCVGQSRISGLLEGDDVLATASAMQALGATIQRDDDGTWIVHGVGVGGLTSPKDPIDMGNSGTGVRLLMGLLATHPVAVKLAGDESLSGRPMGRVITPLKSMGAQFEADSDRLPLTLTGVTPAMPITYDVPVPSAQVKSAVLLAGLNTPGRTTVIEREATRDHTENMLRAMGADLQVDCGENGTTIVLQGPAELSPMDIAVPGDPSSAAFPIVAGLITPGSEVTVKNVCLNPLRAGLYQTLTDMGAALTYSNERTEGGEPVADITARFGPLQGVEVPAERAPSMIDEYPILAMAAAQATGTTVMRGLAELRIKESDRLAAIADGLAANGVTIETGEDWLAVTGSGGKVPGGGTVATHHDHRIAMSFLVLGGIAEAPVQIDDDSMIATSFPTFVSMMNGLGAHIEQAGS